MLHERTLVLGICCKEAQDFSTLREGMTHKGCVTVMRESFLLKVVVCVEREWSVLRTVVITVHPGVVVPRGSIPNSTGQARSLLLRNPLLVHEETSAHKALCSSTQNSTRFADELCDVAALIRRLT